MPAPHRNREGLERDPFWYKSGVIYEVHVRAFYDTNADGTGDFRGLTEKLDYIKDLGVTAIWLLPFYPSPLRDVATLVRSFHYAARAGLDRHVELGGIPPENLPRFESWLRFWNCWVSAACLKAWFETVSASGTGILPDHEDGLRVLLRAYLLASMVNEIGARLKDRSPLLKVPLQGILWLLEEQGG